MKKLCFVTATRAEYGLLKWFMKDVEKAEEFKLQVVVTGAHLLEEQGHTIDIIKNDGFVVDKIVDAQLETTSKETIAESMGRMGQLFSHVFADLVPDYVVVLGDRYELLPIVNTAFVMCIPIIHLSGGDVTEGAIDNGIRNAVTMLSEYHFPGTKDSADNIIRMRGSDRNVWSVGEPGLDSFYRETLMGRAELAENLRLDINKKWILFTFHAETKESLEYNLDTVKNCFLLLQGLNDIQIVATYSNADFGGKFINDYLESISRQNPELIRVVPSLGNRRYLSYMRQVCFVIGNSSSGIVEAPTLGVPVVNIGDRQKGRYQCKNIIQSDADFESIKDAIHRVKEMNADSRDYYWGDGHTAERIMEILKREL
ncbi:UDP-N-acetylglucosamine 2-epimerase [Lachnospiraceae bacterium C1.1]|nr:UDP-N-acetylglucosamine 2-epimerase [Lachnospiraceae bacterium C1.1]